MRKPNRKNGSSDIIRQRLNDHLPIDLASRTSTDNVNMSKWARKARLPGSQIYQLTAFEKTKESVFEHEESLMTDNPQSTVYCC